ncbi:MAG: hydantoinase B/oxoprolinase family protein [Rhodospirillales bacterium]|jgi:N-methylhydantoinase B|nr:hydantoinase B/oxoprolinase family protein [Rhodospirillales bacterium]MDP6883014.1 hydantoinase B/oxoprolinase family protein [Rhodospirillales bacterium]
MENRTDPFTLEIIRNALDTSADNMGLSLRQSAYSSIVRDATDFSTAVCDAEGRTMAQGLTTTLHLGSFYDAMRCLIERQGEDVHGGDIFIFNDPYLSAGQHLPDIYIVKPIFWQGRLEAWATSVAHHADVGGIVPGSNALGAYEIYQEGLRLPILKFYSRGRPNASVMDIISANVRVPDLVIGDLHAQMAACATGEAGVVELFERYGRDELRSYFAAIHDYAERLARVELEKIGDSECHYEDYIDGLGEDPEPVLLKVKVTIQGAQATVDWTGTAKQVDGGINSSLPYTKAAAYVALRSIMRADLPNSHGFTRPIRVIAPEGSLVNPVHPGACGSRGITGYRMIDCLFGALAQVVPERVPADGNGGATLVTFGGYRDRRAFVFCEALMANWGGTATHDGQDGVPHLGGNISNVPVEMIEARYPLRIDRYGLVADSGGAGKYRGGLALARDYRVLIDGVVLTLRSDRRRFPPQGLFGGQPGAPSRTIVNPDGEAREMPVMATDPIVLNEGDVVRHVMAGAGGYGDPSERDPGRVIKDLREGRVSRHRAQESYGFTGLEPESGGA